MDKSDDTERRKWYEMEQALWRSHRPLVERMRLAEALQDEELMDHLIASQMRLACAIERCAQHYHGVGPLASSSA